ncbi:MULTISPECIES: BRO-N domain-containing protein [Bacillus]|uniref:BRO-N domain-containing protein n=1 Tax=Bacillus TaxID=1386 RepID=UPI000AA19717|nr:Bro-N domain-containing protein [Bacillus cereus]
MERDSLVNRVEVLERVKNLLLLPELEVATTQQVADFYNVSLDSLRNVIKRHREELTIDGYKTKTGKEVTDSLRFKMNLKEIKTKIGRYVVTTDDGTEYSFSNKSNALFPKRAILRIGMLLRDSEVAKEVRTQLLNIEENTVAEVKTYEIDYEQEVLGRNFKVYGTVEDPLFLAKDVAEWIDHSNPTMMLKSVDEDEKRLNFVYTSTGNKDAWFLTEDGIYELLMLSRKPIAKQWKKEVKKILKNIRLNGGHVLIDREEDEKLTHTIHASGQIRNDR